MRSTSQLNIKDPETRALALELSRATGESVTAAVRTALRERLERTRRAAAAGTAADQLRAFADAIAALPVLDATEPDEMLYDEAGLPK